MVEKNNSSATLESETAALGPVIAGLEFPALTIKSLVVGALVGAFIALIALYYGLKTGIIPSLNVLAGLLGFMITRLVLSVFKGNFTVQENAVIQTCAVATYSMSGAGFASGLLALTKNSYDAVGPKVAGNVATDVLDLNWTNSFLFCVSVALFGIFIAFPLREEIIIRRKLLFPSGTATAALIKTLHSNYDLAAEQIRLFLYSTGITFAYNALIFYVNHEDSFKTIPIFGFNAWKPGNVNYGWSIDASPGSFAIGLMIPFQISFWMLIGGISGRAIMTTLLSQYHQGADTTNPEIWFSGNGFTGLRAYWTFAGIALILVDTVYSLVKMVYILWKAQKEKHEVVKEKDPEDDTQRKITEKLDSIFLSSRIPDWIWQSGLLVFGIFSVIVLSITFKVTWWHFLVANVLVVPFAIGIIQGVGLTDWNLASSFGKLVMFIFGSFSSGSIIGPLLLCQATIVGCSQAADLMQDFKTGYLVGASPSSMYIAQLVGALISCFVVPSVWVLFNSTYTIPGPDMAGIYGPVYRSLAILAVNGFGALPPHCLEIMCYFGVAGFVVLGFNDFFSGKPWIKYSPQVMPFAIGMLVPTGTNVSIFLGGVILLIWERVAPAQFERSQYIIAAGLLTGDALGSLGSIFYTLANGPKQLTTQWLDENGAFSFAFLPTPSE